MNQGEAVASLNFGRKNIDSETKEQKRLKDTIILRLFHKKIGAKDKLKVRDVKAGSF